MIHPLVPEYEKISIPPNCTHYKINSYNDVASAIGSSFYNIPILQTNSTLFLIRETSLKLLDRQLI